MSYKITASAEYKDGSEIKTEFDTNSKLMHEAFKQAEQEIFMERWFSTRKEPDKPIKTSITLTPF